MITNTHIFMYGCLQRYHSGKAKFKSFRKLSKRLQFSERTTPYIIKSSFLLVYYSSDLKKKLYHNNINKQGLQQKTVVKD